MFRDLNCNLFCQKFAIAHILRCVYQKSLALKYHPLDESAKYIFKIFANATGGFPITQVPLEDDRFRLTSKMFEKLNSDNKYYYTKIK